MYRKGNLFSGVFAVSMVLLALCAWPTRAQQRRNPRDLETRPRSRQTTTRTIDPCVVAAADQLKPLLGGAIKSYFPLNDSKDGNHVTISDPELTNLVCPNLKIMIKARVRYQKTRGFPQFSSSGDVRFTSPLVVNVTHYVVPSGERVKASDILSAKACLTDINVTGLNLSNVPNWLDSTWVEKKLNQSLANRICFDITGLVKLYLQNGGSL